MEEPGEVIARNAAILEGTRAVAPTGELLVLHHATNRTFDRFGKTSDIGFHFGTAAQAANRRRIMIQRGEAMPEDPWRVVSCALAVRNPLVIADDPGIWNPRWLTATLSSFLDHGDRSEIRRLATEMDGRTPGSPITQREKAILDEWFKTLRQALERAGHDGIVYRNVFESSGKAIEWSWTAFRNKQVVVLGENLDAATLPSGDIDPGRPLSLRGAGPMRRHQSYGIGFLMRNGDRKAFRTAVEEWASEAGIAWNSVYPLDYQPSFGECRPSYDLRARIGEASGFFVVACSARGTVTLQPFSQDERPEELMIRFQSDASEGFFDHGTRRAATSEEITWRPAETIGAFGKRLRAVFRDFAETFLPAERPGIRI